MPVLDESRPARQSHGLTDLDHGDRCHRAGEGAEVLHGPNRAWKGKTGGRTLPLHPDLQAALGTLQGMFPSTPRLHALVHLRADLGSAATTGQCIKTSPARHGPRAFHDPHGNLFRSPTHRNNESWFGFSGLSAETG
jgi:hypothetical protein